MRIDLNLSSLQRLNGWVTTHISDGMTHRIEWLSKVYERSKIALPDRFFTEVNGYLATLSQQQQTAVWGVYEDMYSAIQNVGDKEILSVRLSTLIHHLYCLIPWDDAAAQRAVDVANIYGVLPGQPFKNFIKNNVVYIPSTVLDQYRDVDIVERTYLKADYLELAWYSVYLKFLLPLFSEHIAHIEKRDGTLYKEFNAMKLANKSGILLYPACARLRQHIEALTEFERLSPAAVFDSLGSEDIIDYFLARVLVRRAILAEPALLSDDGSIIANIHFYVNTKVLALDRDFTNGDKRLTNKATGDEKEGNMSYVESHNTRQKITDGVKVTLSYSMEDPVKVLNKCSANPNYAFFAEAMKNIGALDGWVPQNQYTNVMMAWVLSKAMSPRGVELLSLRSDMHSGMGPERRVKLTCLLVAQSIVWDWGFPLLASLMVSDVVVDQGATRHSDLRTRLTQETINRISHKYPHTQQTTSKQSSPRQGNQVCIAIDELSKGLCQNDWDISRCCDALRASVPHSNGVIITPTDIRLQLAELILNHL